MEDLTGRKFNYLTVIEFSHRQPQGKCVQYYWKCRCICGKEILVTRNSLMRGRKSCGCKSKKRMIFENNHENSIRHGESKTRLYKIYSKMKERCYYDKNSKYYQEGIKVCDVWKNSYINFRDWAKSHGYKENLTIDRIDNTKDYSPENCRWVTKTEQANNKRNNIRITFNGETLTLSQWADKLGWSYSSLANRYKRGWNVERMLTEIPKNMRK